MLHPSARAGDPGSFCVLIMAACSQQGDSSESESCVLSVLSMGTTGLHVVNSASSCHIGPEQAIISTWRTADGTKSTRPTSFKSVAVIRSLVMILLILHLKLTAKLLTYF